MSDSVKKPEKDSQKPKIIKASDLARIIGVTSQTIRNHVNEGLLNPLIINGRYYFTMDEVARYLGEGKKSGDHKSSKKDGE
jgi:hypothetical protein